mmetsp:Transcript_26214/g.58260  ORF Transcript_26214/g.58260 Transcript_26214/m.58260 type:complete len:495 (-) Transcript_26214:1999-3483(-)
MMLVPSTPSRAISIPPLLLRCALVSILLLCSDSSPVLVLAAAADHNRRRSSSYNNNRSWVQQQKQQQAATTCVGFTHLSSSTAAAQLISPAASVTKRPTSHRAGNITRSWWHKPPRSVLPLPSRSGGISKMSPALDLRFRGGEGAASKLSAAEDDDKSDKVATEALKSIQYCYKTCFAAFLANVVITLIDEDIWSRTFGGASMSTLTWVDYVDALDSMNLLIFGLGLLKISRLYFDTLQDRNRRMTEDALLDLFTTMEGIWGVSAMSLAAISLSTAASLKEHGLGVELLGRFSPSAVPGVVFGVLVIANFAVRAYCSREAAREDQIDEDKSNRMGSKSKPDTPTFELARDMGFRAYRNQALCAGSFAALASMELAKWTLVAADSGIVGSVFSITDFLTPFAITSLLMILNKSFLRALNAAMRTGGGAAMGTVNDEVYNDLFVAQAGFYTKVANTLKSAAIFGLLPYVAAPFKPYVLQAARFVAPSLVDKVMQSQ